jgi:hypothetical protein
MLVIDFAAMFASDKYSSAYYMPFNFFDVLYTLENELECVLLADTATTALQH